jgi:REP element-mobilizing transposase RayT
MCPTPRVAHPYPPYCANFDYIGRYDYLLTFVTFNRNIVFTEARAVDLVLTHLVRAAVEQQFEILVHCFMPDHAHLIVSGMSDASSLKVFAKLGKQYSGYYYRQAHRQRLWQKGIHDRIIRDQVELLDRIRYVVNNPVASGLVRSGDAYPFLGSQRWSVPELIQRLTPWISRLTAWISRQRAGLSRLKAGATTARIQQSGRFSAVGSSDL